MGEITTWRDLKVWQKAHALVLSVYEVTKQFPPDERFSLTQQVRRAAVSVASNIVEGFHRKTTKDSLNFYKIADSSLEEVKYQILVARDLEYISNMEYKDVITVADEVGRMLFAWTKTQKEFNDKLA